jgi:CO/xanthine dehydrogenase FAD-binding subunit
MSFYREYFQPETIEEAVNALANAELQSAVIAGGTDLLLDLRQGRHNPVDQLIDVSGIAAMGKITIQEDMVYLGAAVTHKNIIRSVILHDHARCVVEGCGLIGGPQVRNVATIGGNVSHALPAGDGTISLLALDTEVQLASPDGRSWQPLIDIFAGPGQVNFDRSREIVAAFRFKTRGPREGSAFHRIMRPQGVAIAILNMAAWVRLSDENTLETARISCGPAGPKPFRARKTEQFLTGKNWNEGTLKKAVEVLAEEVSLRTSAYRATREYRHMLLPVLLREVMDNAVRRANS